MQINHNIAALNTYRQLNTASNAQAKSMQKLSSGLRINSAADDAAGLAISEKMRGQIRGLDQASRNAQDGISMVQTAEGALNETHDILQRMRELAVQASNDTNTTDDRTSIQSEMNQLTSEINRIGNTTQFNTKGLINGDMHTTSGATQEQKVITFATSGSVGDEFTADTAHGDVTLTLGGKDYTIKFNENVDGGTTPQVSGANKDIITVGIGTSVANIGDDVKTGLLLATGANPDSSLAQFDFTSSGSTLTITTKSTGDLQGAAGKYSISLKSGLDASREAESAVGKNGSDGIAKLQIGANSDQQFSVDINDMRSLALGVSSTSGGGAFTSAAADQLTDKSGATAEYALDLSTSDKATAALTTIDHATKLVSDERSKLGAYQNRLEHTTNNLNTSSENLTAAESRIRDVDYALAA
ncbi:flagellin [Bacillus salipaludis]